MKRLTRADAEQWVRRQNIRLARQSVIGQLNDDKKGWSMGRHPACDKIRKHLFNVALNAVRKELRRMK